MYHLAIQHMAKPGSVMQAGNEMGDGCVTHYCVSHLLVCHLLVVGPTTVSPTSASVSPAAATCSPCVIVSLWGFLYYNCHQSDVTCQPTCVTGVLGWGQIS